MNHDLQTAKIDGTTLPHRENLPSATLQFDLIKINSPEYFPRFTSYPSIKQYVLANRIGFLPAPVRLSI